MSRRREPGWRDAAAYRLLFRHLPDLRLDGPLLLVGDSHPELPAALASHGLHSESWNRRCRGSSPGTPWPADGSFRGALVRLPRSRDELAMTLHATVSVLAEGGPVVLYGANDEGIKSAAEEMTEVMTEVGTRAVGGRCRLLLGQGVPAMAHRKGRLEDWRESVALGPSPLPSTWVSYPGVFAHGRLDEGTRLLLSCTPTAPAGSKVLDFGCGSGIVAWEVARRSPDAELHLLDSDAVALEAARENVPGATVILRDGMPRGEQGAYNLVVSNPPFHRGKDEDPGMLTEFIDGAGDVLTPRGELVFVAQRRMELEPHLARRFRSVEVLAEDTTFRVWWGKDPIGG